MLIYTLVRLEVVVDAGEGNLVYTADRQHHSVVRNLDSTQGLWQVEDLGVVADPVCTVCPFLSQCFTAWRQDGEKKAVGLTQIAALPGGCGRKTPEHGPWGGSGKGVFEGMVGLGV